MSMPFKPLSDTFIEKLRDVFNLKLSEFVFIPDDHYEYKFELLSNKLGFSITITYEQQVIVRFSHYELQHKWFTANSEEEIIQRLYNIIDDYVLTLSLKVKELRLLDNIISSYKEIAQEEEQELLESIEYKLKKTTRTGYWCN